MAPVTNAPYMKSLQTKNPLKGLKQTSRFCGALPGPSADEESLKGIKTRSCMGIRSSRRSAGE